MLAAALLTAACHMDNQANAVGSPSATNAPRSSAPATSAPAGSARATAGRVVALGDSYAAGALLPLAPAAKPSGCLRSAKAYRCLLMSKRESAPIH